MEPTTRYAQSGDASIAYQVMGEGAVDVLVVPGWVTQIEHLWEAPAARRFFGRLAEFSRLIIYDRRGTGLSDDLADNHTLEQDVLDALAVLDAVGSSRVVVYSKWMGGPASVLLAADHPERVSALVMYASAARSSWAPDYEWAMTPEQRDELVAGNVGEWGEGSNRELQRWAPSAVGDPAMVAWFARLQRLIASPSQARRRWRESGEHDVREVLPRIEVPTLVMHRPQELVWDVRHSQYLAEHIPDARYVELEGEDAIDFVGNTDAIVEEVEEFLTGVRGGGARARALLTVMFTDIVDSTRRASELGDAHWRDLLARHDEVVRKELARYGGREVKTMGDGFLVTFAGAPSSALRCALAVTAAASEIGVDVRIGVHTGECELIGDDIGGMAVHIASRVNGLAGPGQVLVSSPVSGAVAGGEFVFEDRGTHELKGVPGEWSLWALASPPRAKPA
jgi:class 3 adenylate cyclase/alpha-beta hydrolase superfamily lysophospholipase